MTTHELKLDIKYFEDVKNGKKNFEIRKNDRDFKVGDILKLKKMGWLEKTEVPIRFAMSAMPNLKLRQTYLDKSDNPCVESKADTITAKIVYVLSAEYWNETNNLKEFIFDTPEEGNLIFNTIKEFCGTDELLDDYVVLGIEVINI